ncbi:MAG: hypothetical protein ACM3OC_09825 [Deltaproteobacteria bacterium]
MKNDRGFSTLEYACLVSAILIGLISMGVYYRRSLEGKWKAGFDTFGYGRQYDPKSPVTSSLKTTYAGAPATSGDYTPPQYGPDLPADSGSDDSSNDQQYYGW